MLYKTGFQEGYTYSIVKDNSNAIWLAVTGSGIARISEKNKDNFSIQIFRTNEGLKDLMVKYMTKDKQGNLWAVNNGLLYLNSQNYHFELTDNLNGLLGNIGEDDRIMVDKYGNVFCGSQVGINWLNNLKTSNKKSVLNLIIEDVLVNGKSANWCFIAKKKLKLSATAGENNISFNYTAICFDDYDQVRYRYKLDGYDKTWNPVTRNLEARYTNLPPGKYSFVVDVAYKGKWLGYNQNVEFKINKVFWKTWWFIMLIILPIISVLYFIYINRQRHKEKQKRIRQKIASDLHDDLGSTLSSISIMSDIIQSEESNNSSTKEMLQKIHSNAHNMLESMDDIIWSVAPANDEFQNLMLRIREYAIPMFETKDIRFTITAPPSINMPIPMEKRRDVFLIAKEAVNNLVKYANCTEAFIIFKYSHGILNMIIKDNGKGFDVDKEYGRSGLKNMKERAEKIGGKLDIYSKIAEGTTISLTIKL